MTRKPYILAIDIGGTFTDLVLLDQAANQVAVAKVLTSYPDPSQAVLSGVAALLARRQVAPARIERVIHGTTLVTNTLIERKGARTALITTQGFRDALEIGKEGRYDIYDLGLVKPAPLVERRLRLEVPERLDAQGHILEPLDEAALGAQCRRLRAEGIEAVAVVFLHAYANAAHERRAAQIIGDLLPEVAVSLSHAVAPAMREYQRASTTVANAYVQPLTARYLHGLETGLAAAGIEAPLHVMLSTGGVCAVDTAAAFPIRLVESGPAGGALVADYWAKQAGYGEVFAFDMGGTTAKAILSEQGQFPVTGESEVAHVHRFKRGSGLPLLVPMLHMIEIGAGGGSIAHLNVLNLPAVGPESAGSTPGPACYALGGTQPTVTDADLLLGYLNPNYFVGGEMRLEVNRAAAAFEPLAQALELSLERTAWGVHQLVNENMAAAARVHAAERGLDLRNYTMVATGGAGPAHAVGVAQRLGISTIIIPAAAGVGSAFGMLLAPISFDFTRTYLARLAEIDLAELNRILLELEAEGRQIVAAAGVSEADIQVTRAVEMRYVGQGYEIQVPFGAGPIDEATKQSIQAAFEAEYRRFYGRLCVGVPTQVVNWRMVVSGPRLELNQVQIAHNGETAAAQKGSRPAFFTAESGPVETPVYRRYALPPGFQVAGPAIIEEAESTTIVPPGWSARVDGLLNLVLSAVFVGQAF